LVVAANSEAPAIIVDVVGIFEIADICLLLESDIFLISLVPDCVVVYFKMDVVEIGVFFCGNLSVLITLLRALRYLC